MNGILSETANFVGSAGVDMVEVERERETKWVLWNRDYIYKIVVGNIMTWLLLSR